MILELHIIQNFAPSNLNRDDTGSPKSCEFGGYRRARISSQSIKRAIRTEFKRADLVPEDARALRSKRFVETIADRLRSADRDMESARVVAEAGLGFLNIKLAKDQKTQYLLYLGPREIESIAQFCESQWETLAASAPGAKGGGKGGREAEAQALAKQLQGSLDGGRASDLALFGRMLADLPERNIDAASQVAHAISTHQVAADFDYYTAVDDLKPDDTSGADMIGTVEFNSACYYRYSNIDVGQLAANLNGDAELAEATVRAFLIANRDAIPTGKQNSFAARNAPSLLMAVVREHGAWSLANAFVRPVRPTNRVGLIDASIGELDKHWGELVAMYGEPAGCSVAVCALGNPELSNLKQSAVETFDQFLEQTVSATTRQTAA